MESILKIQGLEVNFKNNESGPILENFDLEIPKNSIYSIMGETGSGKTMLAKSILRLLPKNFITRGKIIFNGEDLLSKTEKDMQKIRGHQIGMSFQNPGTALNPLLSNKTQLSLVLGKDEKKIQERLHLVGFEDPEQIMGLYPFQLSGGMKQRFMTALGIGNGAKLLLLDEPTRGSDDKIKQNFIEMLRMLQNKLSITFVLLSHDLNLIEAIDSYCAIIYKGSICEEGKTREIFNNPIHPYTRSLFGSTPKGGMVVQEKIGELDADLNLTYVKGPFKRKKINAYHFVRCVCY